MEEREWKPQQPPEVEDDYLYPSQESSRWGSTNLGVSRIGVRSLRCHLESPASKGRSLWLPGAKTSESPEAFFKDSGEATEACTTRVKTKFGRLDSLARVSGLESKSPAFTGRILQLTRVNSTNVLDEGLRIMGVGHRMNSKVRSVKQGVYRK
jgi:hypothetical protein